MDYETTIVALLDKPSSKSFGVCAILTKREGCGLYEVPSFASGVKLIGQAEVDAYGGHILEVKSLLPDGFSKPSALWLGNQFQNQAEELNAPPLPEVDENWHQPLEPHANEGNYTIREHPEVYDVLDDWVTAAGIEALTKNSFDLASLMAWTLPLSPKTTAAMYFTEPDEEKKQEEIQWQMRIRKGRGKPVTKKELIQEHEETRRLLLEPRK